MNSSPTVLPSEQTDTAPEITPRPRLQLSVTQVVASALATITATVAASFLGIAGTVIGAGVASVLTVVGNAVYSHSIRRIVPRATTPPVPAPEPSRHRWHGAVAACVAVFVAVLLVVTGVELVAGRPLSDVVRGEQGAGTSVLGNNAPRSPHVTPTSKVTVTVTPTVVTATPTVTVTGPAVTSTATPAPSRASSSATGSPTPTPTTSGIDTPSSAPTASPTG